MPQRKAAYQEKTKKKESTYSSLPRVMVFTSQRKRAHLYAEAMLNRPAQTFWDQDSLSYIFDAYFKGIEYQFYVFNTQGNLYERDFDDGYEFETLIDIKDLFDAPTKLFALNKKKIKLIEQLSKGANIVFLSFDNDKIGESLSYEVKNLIVPIVAPKCPFYRTHVTDLIKESIQKAYLDESEFLNFNQIQANKARQVTDLVIGCTFTRLMTKRLRNDYGHLNNSIVSYGPCQSPILFKIVERDEEIQAFIPTTLYEVTTTVNLNGKTLNVVMNQSFKDPKLLDNTVAQVKSEVLTVTEIKRTDKILLKPEGLNATNLLIYASEILRIQPSECMDIADKLFQRGFITLPNTEATYYPHDFPFYPIAFHLSKQLRTYNPKLADVAQYLHDNDFVKPIGSDRFFKNLPISPTINIPDLNQLTRDEENIYIYIVTNFLAAFHSSCYYDEVDISLTADQQLFTISGIYDVEEGFTSFMDGKSLAHQIVDPNLFTIGAQLKYTPLQTKVIKSKPPSHLSQKEALEIQSKHGIGTENTYSTITRNLQIRKLVKLDQNELVYIPTALGKSLIYGIKSVEADLLILSLREELRQDIESISLGRNTYDNVVSNIIERYKQIFSKFEDHIDEFATRFEQNQQFVALYKVKTQPKQKEDELK